MLVIDRSGSMNFDLEGNVWSPQVGLSRWKVLRAVLAATLSSLDQQVAMGLVMYPQDSACGVPSSIDLAPRPENGVDILRRLDITPAGGTPTFDAVMSAGELLASVRGQALVLITDGEPNCNDDLDQKTCACSTPRVGFPPQCLRAADCLDTDRTVDGIRRLWQDRGILTYVIGVGANSRSVEIALDNMAISGGAPRPGGGRNFYNGASGAELAEALEAISVRLTRCSWTTGTPMTPDVGVEVHVGGERVEPGSQGWEWADQGAGSFTLRGAWCDRAAAGEAVTFQFQCR
jgi:hypothetical protein